jgi:L-ascorbate metabolism protein UlaG (beta-lactamase superfamily)
MEPGVTIKYFGHACFAVTDSTSTTVAIDPFDAKVGYPVPEIPANVCLVTHEHFDHSNTAAVSGHPEIVRQAGETTVQEIPIVGVTAPHHAAGEHAERGNVTMFRWRMDGINLIHVGDLGSPLTAEQIAALGPADVLMVPVGGFYTIDAPKAVQAAQDLSAKFVIPMHYKTDATKPDLPIAPVDDFLKALPSAWMVTRLDVNTLTITRAELGKTDAPVRVVVMNCK